MSESDGVYETLTGRLLKHVDPFAVLGWRAEEWPRLEKVLAHSVRRKHVDPWKRPAGFGSYDYGRIRFFLDAMREDIPPDPIEVDNVCEGGRILPYPVVLDGHHRLAAAALAQQERVRIIYGGLVDVLEWLVGDRDDAPEEGYAV